MHVETRCLMRPSARAILKPHDARARVRAYRFMGRSIGSRSDGSSLFHGRDGNPSLTCARLACESDFPDTPPHLRFSKVPPPPKPESFETPPVTTGSAVVGSFRKDVLRGLKTPGQFISAGTRRALCRQASCRGLMTNEPRAINAPALRQRAFVDGSEHGYHKHVVKITMLHQIVI
jgi:hypothetical protein